jgi:hypothetical protein
VDKKKIMANKELPPRREIEFQMVASGIVQTLIPKAEESNNNPIV